MSRHDGVSCDACLKSNFKGRRYKCLICYDYDLCSSCYENGNITNQHTTSHPMQCVLTKHDFELFHGGESLASDQPQSLTCPFCGKMGFTEATLQEHVTANHLDTAGEVICPICASIPGGEPNHQTEDFAAHLTLDHPAGVAREELDLGPSVEANPRQSARQLSHQARGLTRNVARRGMRSVNSGFFSTSNRNDSMDPIAELLSQLSGVRRATASDLLATADAEQATTRQHVERLPATRRIGVATGVSGAPSNIPQRAIGESSQPGASNSSVGVVRAMRNGVLVNLGGANSAGSSAAVITTHQPATSTAASTKSSHNKQQSKFFLSKLNEESEKETEEKLESRERLTFIQDLVVSTFAAMPIKNERETPTEKTECNPAQTLPPAPSLHDASTQTSGSLLGSIPASTLPAPVSNVLSTGNLNVDFHLPITKSTSTSSASLSKGHHPPLKGGNQKSQGRLHTRVSPGMPRNQLAFHNYQNVGSGRPSYSGPESGDLQGGGYSSNRTRRPAGGGNAPWERKPGRGDGRHGPQPPH